MKTPQEAAREYAESKQAFQNKDIITEASAAFLAGDAFGYRRGMEKAYRWISVDDELPDYDTLILAKDTDCHIDLIRGWQLKERIKPYAVQNFYTHWRPI
jgi:hypothetical protein